MAMIDEDDDEDDNDDDDDAFSDISLYLIPPRCNIFLGVLSKRVTINEYKKWLRSLF